jgi:hypothetical protein
MGADGPNDAVGGGLDRFGLFHEEFEAAAGAGGALMVEIEGARMAVDDAAVGEAEFLGDGGGPLIEEEGQVDGVAFRVAADGAAGCVTVEIYRAFLVSFRGTLWACDPDEAFFASGARGWKSWASAVRSSGDSSQAGVSLKPKASKRWR